MTTSLSNTIDWLEMWYAAHSARIGIIIKTDNPRSCLNHLYSARRRLADPDLESLYLTVVGDEVWIVHKEVSVEEE